MLNKKYFYIVLTLGTLYLCGLVSGCSWKVEEEFGEIIPYNMLTEKGLLAVSAPDENNVWVVGHGGIILHSDDAGKTWHHQTPPVEIDLFDIFFIDNKEGWIVGKYGKAFHTTDKGKNWLSVETGTEERLFSIFFTDRENGWAVGSRGIIIHTNDSGKTWQRQHYERADDPFGDKADDIEVDMAIYSLIHGDGEILEERLEREYDDSILNRVYFIDKDTGWIVGEYGLILNTRDGGKTWVHQECPDLIPEVEEHEWEIQPPTLFAVYFKTPEKGFAGGLDCSIVVTEDGGDTWKKLFTDSDLALYGIVLRGDYGTAVGTKGAYYYSRDGGRSWIRDTEALNTNFWLRDISFSNDDNGWIVGSFGTILKTTDGGSTWDTVSGITIDEIEERSL